MAAHSFDVQGYVARNVQIDISHIDLDGLAAGFNASACADERRQ
jgi:hypothetical protein